MTPEDQNKASNRTLKIFNYIGGTLIFFGVVYFILNNWFYLGDFLKIFASLGVGIAAFTMAVLFELDKKHLSASAAFFMIAGLILPLGLTITFNTLGLMVDADIDNIVITGICLALYFTAYINFQRQILLLFCLFFGSTFFLALTTFLVNHGNPEPFLQMIYYQMFALGLLYLLLGYYSSLKKNAFTGLLYFFGDLFVLLGSFHLGGLLFFDEGTLFWQIAAPALMLLSFVLAIPLQSKSLLYLASIFLVIYITSLTRQYAYLFGSLGWPLVLIISGFALMILGYVVVYLQKKIPRK